MIVVACTICCPRVVNKTQLCPIQNVTVAICLLLPEVGALRRLLRLSSLERLDVTPVNRVHNGHYSCLRWRRSPTMLTDLSELPQMKLTPSPLQFDSSPTHQPGPARPFSAASHCLMR